MNIHLRCVLDMLTHDCRSFNLRVAAESVPVSYRTSSPVEHVRDSCRLVFCVKRTAVNRANLLVAIVRVIQII